MDPTIQKNIIQFNQTTWPRQINQNHFPIISLNSSIGVTRSGQNIDNHTGMNPQGLIVTTIPKSNKSNNCYII